MVCYRYLQGYHQLIQQGMKLVKSAQNIVEELGGRVKATIVAFSDGSNGEPTNKSENLECQRLLATMGWGPITVDMLVDRTGLTPHAVSSMLRILKLDGRAK